MKKHEKMVFLKTKEDLSSLGHTATKFSLCMKIYNHVKKISISVVTVDTFKNCVLVLP